jgi:hypothetical protein
MVLPFRCVVSIDFEYRADPGHRPHVWCLVARDHDQGEIGRWWRNELLTQARSTPSLAQLWLVQIRSLWPARRLPARS